MGPSPLRPGLGFIAQLIPLIVGFAGFGWCLACLASPWPIWLGTLLATMYVLWVGQAGIFLASVWATVLISLVIIFNILPPLWLEYFDYRLWPASIILFWGTSVLLFTMLANYTQGLQPLPRPARFWWRLGSWLLLLVGLGLGALFLPKPVFLTL